LYSRRQSHISSSSTAHIPMHRRLIKSILLAVSIALTGGLFIGRSSVVLAQQHTGTNFWVAFPGNSVGADQIQLYIVGTDPTTGTVTFDPGSSCAPLSAAFT